MGNFPTNYSDTYCKVVVVTPNFFAFAAGIAGLQSNGQMVVDINSVIRQTPSSLSPNEFAKAVVTKFANSFSAPLVNARANDFTDIYFVGTTSSGLGVVNGHLDFSVGGINMAVGTITPFSAIPIHSGRHEALFKELLDLNTDRVKILNDEILGRLGNRTPIDREAAKLTGVVQGIINWSDDKSVGGKVQTIVLERGQALRWYARPDFCPEK